MKNTIKYWRMPRGLLAPYLFFNTNESEDFRLKDPPWGRMNHKLEGSLLYSRDTSLQIYAMQVLPVCQNLFRAKACDTRMA
jgi:hypothetical protein